MSDLAELTAIVLSWRSPHLAVRSVRSLLAEGVPAHRVIVVDNDSTAETRAEIRDALDVRLLSLEENTGFARANNEAASLLTGSAYLFVNNDAFVHRSGSVRALVDVLADARVGVVVPRLLNEDLSTQPSVAPFFSAGVALAHLTGVAPLLPDRMRADWGGRWSHREERRIQAATGAVMLVRHATWEVLGGFAERTFMYAEDRDLCWRAGRSGWEVHYTPRAQFVHLAGASARRRWTSRERAVAVGRAEAQLVDERHSPPVALAVRGMVAAGFGWRALLWTLLGRRERRNEALGYAMGFAQRAAGREGYPASPKTSGLMRREWDRRAQADAFRYIEWAHWDGNVEAFFALGEQRARQFLDPVLEALPDLDRGVAVDVGCGAGRFSRPLGARFRSVVGVDVSGEMVELAQELHPSGDYPALEFRLSDGVQLPVEDGSTDFVFSYEVFQHMPSQGIVQRNLEEIRRALRPGGVALVHVPCRVPRAGRPPRLRLVLRQLPLPLQRGLKRLLPGSDPLTTDAAYRGAAPLAEEELVDLWSRAGLEVVELRDDPTHTANSHRFVLSRRAD